MSSLSTHLPSPSIGGDNGVNSAPSSTHSSPWIRKPLSVVRQQESSRHNSNQNLNKAAQASLGNTDNTDNATNHLHRHLTLMDLIGIGVGGTVGSGIFVLVGQIAAQYAGRATYLSFALAGAAACLSGACYAELSGRIPAAGSTYVYAYVCLGELAAVLAAACLTLEYAVAGAAVARTWGDKVNLVLQHMLRNKPEAEAADNSTPSFLNIPAFLISAFSTVLLLSGVQESKRVINWVTTFKMIVVAFMVVGGFLLSSTSLTSSQPLAPFGAAGVLRGATTSFFGYLGYDEVCCVAGEAKHPARDMPRAVLGTLLIVTVCYILAAVSLTGMLSYMDISPAAGFPDAFQQRGWEWAARITALGEILSLPVVVIISLLAQPRLTLSMAVDGLLPRVFAHVDESGNLYGGTLVSGIAMTIIATFVPFTYLDDLISAGILFAFSMTNSCLVLLRCQSPIHQPYLLEFLLVLFNALCFLTAMLWTHSWSYLPLQGLWASLSSLATMACLVCLVAVCPTTTYFGGSVLSEGEYINEPHITHHHDTTNSNNESTNDQDTTSNEDFEIEATNVEYFATPAVPYLPCLGMAVNWYLIAQLDILGIFLLCSYLGITAAVYMLGCAPYSVGHNRNWSTRGDYQTVTSTTAHHIADIRFHDQHDDFKNKDNDDHIGHILRNISL